MKRRASLALCLALLFPQIAISATCRSGEAAARGGQVGYERDTKAAEETAKKTASWSDVLSKCVGGMSGVFNGGAFPSIEGELQKLKDKICGAAREQVAKATSGINGAIGGATGGTVGVTPTLPGGNASDEFWSEVWR